MDDATMSQASNEMAAMRADIDYQLQRRADAGDDQAEDRIYESFGDHEGSKVLDAVAAPAREFGFPDDVYLVAYCIEWSDGHVARGVYNAMYRTQQAAEDFIVNYASTGWDECFPGRTVISQDFAVATYALVPF